MSLMPSIVSHLNRIRELSSQQGGLMHDLKPVLKVLNDQALTRLVTELQMLQASMQAEVNWLKVEIGAAQMTGEYAKPAMAVTELELHPANLPLPHPELPREQVVWTGERMKPQGSLSAEELMRMQAARRCANDRTMDLNDDDDLIDHEEVRP